jgi:hypothetical protein
MGFFFVLNRLTGEPIYPIEEKQVPRSQVPGEQASPTQPYVAVPEPVVPDAWTGISRLADIAGLGACSRELKELRYDGPVHAAEPAGQPHLSLDPGRCRMGRRRRRPDHAGLCRQQLLRGAGLSAAEARGL